MLYCTFYFVISDYLFEFLMTKIIIDMKTSQPGCLVFTRFLQLIVQDECVFVISFHNMWLIYNIFILFSKITCFDIRWVIKNQTVNAQSGIITTSYDI